MPLTKTPCDLASAPGGNDPIFILAVCGPLGRLAHPEARGADRRGWELPLCFTRHVAHRFLLPDRVIQKDSGCWDVLLAYAFVLLVILLVRHGAPVGLARAPPLHA